jgi:hypothetical protein
MRAIGVAALAAAGVVAFSGAASASPVHTAATFGVTAGSYNYDSTYVPAGARAQVERVETGDGRTIVTLQVFGLLPDRDYGAHAHKFACGPLPTDAGGHFQYVQGGASDPAFANAQNEIWLDLHPSGLRGQPRVRRKGLLPLPRVGLQRRDRCCRAGPGGISATHRERDGQGRGDLLGMNIWLKLPTILWLLGAGFGIGVLIALR